jgi:hypothetical protein
VLAACREAPWQPRLLPAQNRGLPGTFNPLPAQRLRRVLAHGQQESGAQLKEGRIMKTCEVCGNHYDKTFEVVMQGEEHTFDSFECAIHALAPTCANCGLRIIGHGLEANGRFFCCDHCAEAQGVHQLRDRLPAK